MYKYILINIITIKGQLQPTTPTHANDMTTPTHATDMTMKSDCSGKEQSREKKDKDTSSYPGSFHNTEVVQSPLHFQGDFTIITKITTAQYFLSMRLHKKCSSTHARVFQCSSTKQETSNAQARRQETSNQTKIQRIEFELNT
ncbi:hypothetical protein MTR_7g071037 [Medicago truncatula]|uniref:Uncharacterized protein n=1 Tax=Medicago truncatula TaxID=3880 RepID=A0A072UBL8_MEDTR|nr:hypothetical protein MTR_7g071037 [Medicago truncatula]